MNLLQFGTHTPVHVGTVQYNTMYIVFVCDCVCLSLDQLQNNYDFCTRGKAASCCSHTVMTALSGFHYTQT